MSEKNSQAQSSSSKIDSSSQLPHTRPVELQSVDDYLKENEPPTQAPQYVQQQAKKKKKVNTAPDEDVVVAEKTALAELGDGVNWVGKLQEYRAANPRPFPPHSPIDIIYTETTAIHNNLPRFTTTVLIAENAVSFSGTISFSNKKDAKRYAAKVAVDWLIANQFMPADGSVRFPKGVLNSAASAGSATGTGSGNGGNDARDTGVSLASQVPALCHHLGFNHPTYVEEKLSDNMYNMYATFGGDPRLEARVGEVKGIFGRANAKEKCAEEVLRRLRSVEREREGLARNERGDGEGKKEDDEKFFDC